MPPEKRNKFLDADESDDDDSQGYNSEAEELQKGGRIAKRRKLSDDAASDDDNDEVSAGEESEHEDTINNDNPQRETSDLKTDEDKLKSKLDALPELPDVSRPLTKKNLVATEKAVKKSGLIYLSRVPPFMKPAKLRSLLEPYGKINRIFLTPEDPQERSRRVRQGGNKKHMYTDGWVEFAGRRTHYYRDDIWSLLYLKGFKWHNLTEQINSEMAERTSRMRAEISKSTKENKEFVRNIERAKMLEGMQTKAAAKRSREEKDNSTTASKSEDKSIRTFKQASVAKKGVDLAPDEAKRVLSKLF
ncbi:Pre-rRNA-processing protein ESF2 [Daldinia childiae]|uniref:Pre-rRNA-processing protein ESF2 n=1 Tax=Daldinia childiae TaxID=326645 RepID=UPI001444C70C|nr:Pre-rRNA-processing protein ESF2 [Daldinia childiae]KAF3066475.1 Pre-rRNA-processing protein ESF2 [Daldinia childiae]